MPLRTSRRRDSLGLDHEIRQRLQLRGAETCGGATPTGFFGFSVPA